MTRRTVHRMPTTGLRQTLGTAATTRAAALPATTVRRDGSIRRDPNQDIPRLADVQDATPADNDTGKPETPTESGDPFDNDGEKEERGIIDAFDRLGE
jgi:hypothetical protein